LPEKQKVKVPKDASELIVITRAKALLKYVLQITQKCPKQFRFSLVAKLHNYSINALENLFRANDIVVKPGLKNRLQQRVQYQFDAITELRLLGAIAMVATEHECILLKQYNQICKRAYECISLVNNWSESDKRRFAAV